MYAVCWVGLLAGLGGSVVSVGNTELGPFFRQVDDLSRQVAAARVAILGEALSHGVVAGSECATAAGWVLEWAPSFRAGGAGKLVRVPHATLAVRNVGLVAAVLGARVGVRNAAVVLDQMDKLRPRLRDEAVEAVWAGFLAIATDHGPAPDGVSSATSGPTTPPSATPPSAMSPPESTQPNQVSVREDGGSPTPITWFTGSTAGLPAC